MRIGFVGTGTMGTPIAQCLMTAGHDLAVFDIRPEATATLATQGAAVFDTAAAAARVAEVVFISLPGPKEVEETMLAPQTGILAGLQRGGVCIDLTTNAPATIRQLADACDRCDVRFKDVELACALAREVAAPATLGHAASDLYRQAQAEGWGQDGFPVVARLLERMAGAELRGTEKKS